MYLAEVISVIIGLIFVWMILGIAVMQIQEWMVGWLGVRGDSLEDAIWGMLGKPKERRGFWGRFWEQLNKRAWFPDLSGHKRLARILRFFRIDPEIQQPPNLVALFYRHPYIEALGQDKSKPSYLPPESFSIALFETIMIAGAEVATIHETLSELIDRLPTSADEAVKESLKSLRELAVDAANDPNLAAELRQAVLAFGKEYPDLQPLVEALIRARLPKDAEKILLQVEKSAANLLLDNPQLKQRIDIFIGQALALAKESENKLSVAQQNAEAWFNETMDRLNGWYKRNRQWGAFAIGLILVTVLNIDTLNIAKELWRQPALREAVVIAATEEVRSEGREAIEEESGRAQAPTGALEQAKQSLVALDIPIGWRFTAIASYDARSQVCSLLPNTDEGEVGGISWNGQCLSWEDQPKNWGILSKLVGLSISAAAAMQGAPFWFDILEKLIAVRSAGIKPKDDDEDQNR